MSNHLGLVCPNCGSDNIGIITTIEIPLLDGEFTVDPTNVVIDPVEEQFADCYECKHSVLAVQLVREDDYEEE
ncbi:hypothetical protein [Acidimangrovimonas pyrenivorans]|uniref:CpXC domain-containing protein n=1 Tax=Acidimangrovimonas pyrenivorans TaxID=2030798 RepID=A0ABV7AEJ2_9RHOB